MQCPCWPATWCRWGQRWRWHSGQSWAWQAWMLFLGMTTHRSSGMRHTFQLRISRCWSTVDVREKQQERRREVSPDQHGFTKRIESVGWGRKRKRHKYGWGWRLRKHGEQCQADRHFSTACLKAAFVLSDRSGHSLGLGWPLKHFFMSLYLHLLPADFKRCRGR